MSNNLPICVVPQFDDDGLGCWLPLARRLHRCERILLHLGGGVNGECLLLIWEDVLLVGRDTVRLLVDREGGNFLQSTLLGLVVGRSGRAGFGRHDGRCRALESRATNEESGEG